MKDPRHRGMIGTFFGLLVGILVVGCLTVILQTWTLAGSIRETQKGTTASLDASSQTLRRITNCTTPGRRCYEISRRHLGKEVDIVAQAVAAASACSDRPGPQTYKQILACVHRRIDGEPLR